MKREAGGGGVASRSFEAALSFFSAEERQALYECACKTAAVVCEIRLYAKKAVLLQTDRGLFFCRRDGTLTATPTADRWVPDEKTLFAVLSRAAAYSLFLYEDTLRQGFLSKNGCRIGVCGMDSDGKVSPGGISSLHIRIPYIVDHSPCPALERILRQPGGVLVVGAPCSGKTTLLKRCVCYFGSGALGRFYSVAVIDTRGEFADAAANDPAVLTADIVAAPDKAAGIQTAVRLLSPEVVVCDEIGSPAEARQLFGLVNAGVRVCASVHAGSPAELGQKKQIVSLLRAGVFRHLLFLSGETKGRIDRCCSWEETADEICGGAVAVAAPDTYGADEGAGVEGAGADGRVLS